MVILLNLNKNLYLFLINYYVLSHCFKSCNNALVSIHKEDRPSTLSIRFIKGLTTSRELVQDQIYQKLLNIFYFRLIPRTICFNSIKLKDF